MRETNFDGLVGPTHNYAGLSRGNLASTRHAGTAANPKAAALEGLAKMRFLAQLGVSQAVLPPQERPHLKTLRRLGFTGTDAQVLAEAGKGDGHLLRLASSASAMWTANAATVAPSCDTKDGRMHLTVANLTAMFHRSLEPDATEAVFRAIFADTDAFAVHPALPPGEHFSDEGAANHTRLSTEAGVVHLFGWGRSSWEREEAPPRYPRRQTREASLALARLNQLKDGMSLPWQQDPAGIDAGAFHSDVLAVGNESVLLVHEHAFAHRRDCVSELRKRLGGELHVVLAHESDLPMEDAVRSYPFNSQLVTLPSGRMALIAPSEARDCENSRRYIERVLAEDNPVTEVHYVNVNASMNNGGGPACLRLRVPLTDEERARVRARVFLDDALYGALSGWVERHYRDRLDAKDLEDPKLLEEGRAALDELTGILALGSVYDFQRP